MRSSMLFTINCTCTLPTDSSSLLEGNGLDCAPSVEAINLFGLEFDIEDFCWIIAETGSSNGFSDNSDGVDGIGDGLGVGAETDGVEVGSPGCDRRGDISGGIIFSRSFPYRDEQIDNVP